MRLFSYRPLLGLVAALIFLAGCSDDFLTEANGPDGVAAPKADLLASVTGPDAAPRSAARPVLRHPQLLEHATSRLKSEDPGRARQRQAAARRITERNPSFTTAPVQGKDGVPAFGKAVGAPTSAETTGILLDAPVAAPYARLGDEQTHLFLAFNEYEADGVTPRILDQWGITQRILTEYGVTRRVLQEYGITSRVLEEYGVTRRVMQEYGGLTMELLDAYGITQRIMQDYGVTRAELEAEIAAWVSSIRLRLRVSKAYPGISVSFGSDLLDALLLEMSDDPDILFVEPDAEMEGGSFYLREGFRESGEMVPWNTARVGGVFTDYWHTAKVHVFLLDSGIYDRDLKVVEAKDFTMLFVNRDVETWDDNDFADMPVFDPGELGDPADYTGHGTHAAGTIGAENNGLGIRGMAPQAKIHSLKVLTDQGRTDVTTVVAALDYVTDFKQRNPTESVVANLSLGMNIGTTAYNVLDEAVKRATQFGVTVVVSAGNDSADAATYSPAHVAEAITVGAYDREDRFAAFSNYGSVVDLLAPGDLVVSLTHLASEAAADENVLMSGTSMAAPHVTAAAALYLYQNPEATPAQVQAALVGYSRAGIAGVPEGTTSHTVHVAEFADDGNTEMFEFMSASWNAQARTVLLKGWGPRLDVVDFYDVATRSKFAETTITETGTFRVEVPGPDRAPCTVLAVYRGSTLDPGEQVRRLANPPAECDATALILHRAEWNDYNSELVIEGSAPAGSLVTIVDANTDETITTVEASATGVFQVQGPVFGYGPCAVRAELSNGSVSPSLAVENASSNCTQGGEVPVGIESAQWDATQQTLRITGRATPGVVVAAFSGASGASLAPSAQVGGSGVYVMSIQNPAVLPCRVRVEATDGTEAEALVSDRTSGVPPNTCEEGLSILYVHWMDEVDGFEVYGSTLSSTSVEVRNARSGALLGTAHSGVNGEFTIRETNLATAPCRLTISSGGMTEERAVANAPASCDKPISISNVNWNGSVHDLVVAGLATGGASVTLINPDNGAALATTVVDVVGSFGFTLRLLPEALPPCRIQAVGPDGETAEHTLTASCDPNFTYTERPADEIEQNPHSFIFVKAAQWRGGRLFVDGRGYIGMTVTLRNASTGEVLDTVEVDGRGKWSFGIRDLVVPPCTIEAVLDGRVVTRDVQDAPANCRN